MRVWNEGVAPPASLTSVDVVVGPTVRGQLTGLTPEQLAMLGLWAGGLGVGLSQISNDAPPSS